MTSVNDDTVSPHLQAMILAWFKWEILPLSHPSGTLLKVEEEMRELREAWDKYEKFPGPYTLKDVGEECADVFISLIAFAFSAGVKMGAEVRSKHDKNKTRRWGPPDDAGVRRHV